MEMCCPMSIRFDTPLGACALLAQACISESGCTHSHLHTRQRGTAAHVPHRDDNAMQGMLDKQIDRLCDVLRLERIWAINVGENFEVTQNAWQRFARALPATAVAHLYVEENNLLGTTLKNQARHMQHFSSSSCAAYTYATLFNKLFLHATCAQCAHALHCLDVCATKCQILHMFFASH